MSATSLQMYDRLLSLPLFLGLSQSDLHEVAAHTPLAFSTYEEGEVIVAHDTPCTALTLLIQGTVESHIESDDHQWSLEEHILAPYMHQPEHLFGWHQRYTRRLRAHSTCQILRIEKQDVDNLVQQFQTIRFNLLNTLCIRSQRLAHQPWRVRAEGIEAKLYRWLEEICESPLGPKTLYIKQVHLAQILGESRLNLSHFLRELEKQGAVTLGRGMMRIEGRKTVIDR